MPLINMFNLVPECPEGQVYSLAASACPATCADPDAPLNCPLAGFEGCACADGHVVSSGNCVPAEQCPCTDAGTTHQVGNI